jgi:hypothetical protein
MKIIVIGYEVGKTYFIARGDSSECNCLTAYVLANRENALEITDQPTIDRIDNGDTFEIVNDAISFSAFDALPTLVVTAPSRYVIVVGQANTGVTITGTLTKNGQTHIFTGELELVIALPGGKILPVLADFTNGVSSSIFIPDEGGVWLLAVKGDYGTYKILEDHPITVIYKLPSL